MPKNNLNITINYEEFKEIFQNIKTNLHEQYTKEEYQNHIIMNNQLDNKNINDIDQKENEIISKKSIVDNKSVKINNELDQNNITQSSSFESIEENLTLNNKVDCKNNLEIHADGLPIHKSIKS